MVEIAASHLERFRKIKSNVEDSETSFEENKKRFEADRKFLFQSTLTDRDEQTLADMGKPSIKINICEAFVSRLRGEWAKQVPMLEVKGTGNTKLVQQQEIVEGYLRSIFSGSDYELLSNKIYGETLSGGYSVLKVITEYRHEDTFEQVIRLNKPSSPTLCGFDPLAREAGKGDGKYCYELIPKSKEEFEEEYPDINVEDINYQRNNLGSFNWSYSTRKNQKVLYICDYYEKIKKKETLVLVSNIEDPNKPTTMTLKEFKAMKDGWLDSGRIEDEPVELKRRHVLKTKIINYKFIGDQIIEKPNETDYSYLPLVFFDGNSAILNGSQMTRSYIYNAKGPQRLKNYAASSLVDAFENLRQSTIMVASEALPHKSEYQQAWTNPQKAKGALVFDAFDKENKPLPPPQYFQQGEVNPLFLQLYNNEDRTIQTVLGSYDAQLGIQTKQLSGVAIQEGATQSNAAAMPFVDNYLASLSQIAKIIIDLIPKYYKTATTIPIINRKGEHEFITINEGKPETDLVYNQNDLEVVVKPGVNFEIQKNRALQTFIELMKVSETFKAMVETEALPLLLDNLDIKGQDKLKLTAEDFMKQMKEAKAQQAKMKSSQPNPELVYAQAEQQKAQAEQMKAQNQKLQIQMRNNVEQVKLQQDKMKIGIEALKIQGDLLSKQQSAENEQQRTDAEIAIKRTEQVIKISKELMTS